MAASITYKLNPTTASTFGSTDLVGCQSFTIAESADEVLLSSDGKPHVMSAFYDNVSATVTVEMSQPPKAIRVGDVGTLTLRGAERANGDGVGAGVLTFTSAASGAVVSGYDSTVSHAGNATCSVTFRLVSVDGTTAVFAIA